MTLIVLADRRSPGGVHTDDVPLAKTFGEQRSAVAAAGFDLEDVHAVPEHREPVHLAAGNDLPGLGAVGVQPADAGGRGDLISECAGARLPAGHALPPINAGRLPRGCGGIDGVLGDPAALCKATAVRTGIPTGRRIGRKSFAIAA